MVIRSISVPHDEHSGTSGCQEEFDLLGELDQLSSRKRLHNYGKSPFLPRKLSINGQFHYVTNYQRVTLLRRNRTAEAGPLLGPKSQLYPVTMCGLLAASRSTTMGALHGGKRGRFVVSPKGSRVPIDSYQKMLTISNNRFKQKRHNYITCNINV